MNLSTMHKLIFTLPLVFLPACSMGESVRTLQATVDKLGEDLKSTSYNFDPLATKRIFDSYVALRDEMEAQGLGQDEVLMNILAQVSPPSKDAMYRIVNYDTAATNYRIWLTQDDQVSWSTDEELSHVSANMLVAGRMHGYVDITASTWRSSVGDATECYLHIGALPGAAHGSVKNSICVFEATDEGWSPTHFRSVSPSEEFMAKKRISAVNNWAVEVEPIFLRLRDR